MMLAGLILTLRQGLQVYLPIVIGFKGSCFIQSHVRGLFVAQLCQLGIKGWQMKGGNVLVCERTAI